VNRIEVCRIIEARMREIFEMLRAEIRRQGRGCCRQGSCSPAVHLSWLGLRPWVDKVLTCRSRGRPTGIGGLTDNILNPAYSTAIGLLYWGAKGLESGEVQRFESAPAGGLPSRLRDAIRNLFP